MPIFTVKVYAIVKVTEMIQHRNLQVFPLKFSIAEKLKCFQ